MPPITDNTLSTTFASLGAATHIKYVKHVPIANILQQENNTVQSQYTGKMPVKEEYIGKVKVTVL